MPIDVAALLNEPPRTRTTSWTAAEVILYHLAVGAGSEVVDDGALAYLLEDRLMVLPTYAVLTAFPLIVEALTTSPALDVDLGSVLHAEQEIEVLGPLPRSAEVVAIGRFCSVRDTGRHALLVHESTVSDRDGCILVRCRSTTCALGEGGGGAPPDHEPPDHAHPVASRDADLEVSVRTTPAQALLYRLTGDRNPIHSDPEAARRAGFDRPILHGLCTYGIVARTVVDRWLGGEVARLDRLRGRFVAAVLPGEELQLRLWDTDTPGELVVEARVPSHDTVVLQGTAAYH